MPVLAVMLLSCALYGLPGALLYLLLRERGYGLIPSVGVGIALLTVLYSTLASLMGYSLWLHLSMTLLLDVFLIAFLIQRTRPGTLPSLRMVSGVARWEFLLIVLIAAVYLIPAYLVPVPFDTDAQGFGLLIATVRSSGSITTLAPFYPEINWLYSPGYFLLGALITDITGAGIHEVMLGFSHLLSLGVIAGVGALAHSFGGQVRDNRLISSRGWWAALATAGGVALFTTLMDSAYTNVYGLWLTATFLWTLGHSLEHQSRLNLVISGLCLASVLLGHPDSIIHLLLAYLLFYATATFVIPSLTKKQYICMTVSIPFLGVLFSLPWLARILPLISQIDVHERQFPQLHHLTWMLQINGVWVPILAALGLFLVVRRRNWLDVWSATWILPIIEISSLGNLDRLSRQTALDPMQVFYPFGVAWHATVIPLPLLAARVLESLGFWVASSVRSVRWDRCLEIVVGVLILTFSLSVVFREPIIKWSKLAVKPITGAIVSEADISAYYWLRSNTPRDARLLNYPGRYEGQWVPVVTERYSVFFRDQLFYIGAEAIRKKQATMVEAYLDPNSELAYDVLRRNSIAYVVVPQALSRSEIPSAQLRWKPAALLEQRSHFKDAPYLKLVADFDGAQVWQVQDIVP